MNMFDCDDDDDDDIPDDELEQYLHDPTKKPDNVIAWWIAKASIYPCLSRMALDFLTIPATSTKVERLFSHGWLLLPYVCNCLSAHSTHALLCLGYWSKASFVDKKAVLIITGEKLDPDAQDLEDADGYKVLLEGYDADSE
jgi:hypothetical protein